MNTFTQKQMTTGRDAFGLSLLAGKVLSSLSTSPKAYISLSRNDRTAANEAGAYMSSGDWKQPRADFFQACLSQQDGARCHRREHAQDIRGGNP